jgi:anti-sigma factor RsiW
VLDILLRPWIASCHETSERLSDFVDGELDGRRLARVRRHLWQCERCRAMLASLTRTLDELRALAHFEPARSPATVRAVIDRVERETR